MCRPLTLHCPDCDEARASESAGCTDGVVTPRERRRPVVSRHGASPGGPALRRLRALALAVSCAAASSARAETIEVQVNRAIERGVAAARRYLDGGGVGTTPHHKDYPEGDTAFVLYTLVKSGVSADDPQVQKAVAWLRGKVPARTYSAALVILALDALKDRQYDGQIQAAAGWIESTLRTDDNRWSYPGDRTDLSNTQYAVLGLWTAERHGFKAREDTWAALLSGVPPLQNSDDGFGYRADSRSTGAMTVAGVTVLELALARSPSGQLPARFADVRQKAKTALDRGWAYLERRFSVTGNPIDAHALHETWFHYYLYGLERLCAIAARDRVGEHDWYAEGARELVATQRDDGSWGEPANTCFALLFLRRATFTTLDRPVKPLEGDGVTLRARPAPPAADVPLVRRWLVLGPIDDPDDDLIEKTFFDESRARPADLAFSGPHRWNATRSPPNEVDLGGPDGPRDNVLSCAFVYVHAATDTDAVLWLGHDNGCRLWFDGKLVHDRHFIEAYGPDSFPIPVRLTAGPHRLLAKVRNDGGAHTLWLRIARPDGSRPTGVRTSLRNDSAEFEAEALANPAGIAAADLLCLLPREPRGRLTFDTPDQLDRLAFEGCYGPYPLWSDDPSKRRSDVANPGAAGVLGIHPVDTQRPMTAWWKTKLPEKLSRLRLRVSATTGSSPGKADAILKVAVFDGQMHEVAALPVGPDAALDAKNWRWLEADLSDFDGREVLVALRATDGGKTSWHWEGIWIDEMEIRSGL